MTCINCGLNTAVYFFMPKNMIKCEHLALKYLLKLVEKHFHMVKYFRISFVFNIYDSYLRSDRFVTMDRGKHTNYT